MVRLQKSRAEMSQKKLHVSSVGRRQLTCLTCSLVTSVFKRLQGDYVAASLNAQNVPLKTPKKLVLSEQLLCPRPVSVTHDVRRTFKIHYLGTYIVAGRQFRCSITYVKRSFHRSLNAIFGKVGRLYSI